MQSPFKRVIVYDLETGGLSSKYNSITEAAFVAVDLESLEIIDELSVMILPRLDLTEIEEDPIKEAKNLFKMLKVKDTETGLNILKYKEHNITLKNLDPLIEDLNEFLSWIQNNGSIIEYKEFLKLEEDNYLSDIVKLYFDKCYNPQALEVTHIPRSLIEEEGIEYSEAFNKVFEFFNKHKVGNSKPILCGHNIKRFDNPFLEKFFESNIKSLHDVINKDQIIDTLEWARLKWFEMPSYALGVVANEVGLTLKEAHRALPDTVANAKFLIKMFKHLRGEGSLKSSYKRRKFNFNF